MYRNRIALAAGCSATLLASIVVTGCGKVVEHTVLVCTDAGRVFDGPTEGAADGGVAGDGAATDGATENDGSVSEPKCTTGPCCAAGKFANAITTCASTTEYQCTVNGCGGVRQQRSIRQYCSGTSPSCDGRTEADAWQDISACADDEICVAGGDSVPTCSQCPADCDPGTNTCKIVTLWTFKTAAAFRGNDFGGIDVPANVRGGADGKCLETYAVLYETRKCNSANVHAILHVSTVDSIALMRSRYDIPTDAPVLRAEDEVLVADNWSGLVSAYDPLHAPVSTATVGNGRVWTGANQQDTCTNWTSGNGKFGEVGDSTSASAGWFDDQLQDCDLSAGLACVCW